MDVSGLGVPLGTTPFDAGVPARLEFPPVFPQLTPAVCGTGDSFATTECAIECDVRRYGRLRARQGMLARTNAVHRSQMGDRRRRLTRPVQTGKATCTTRPSASCSCTNTSRRWTHECPQCSACAPAVRRRFLCPAVLRRGRAPEDRHRRHRQHRRRARDALGEGRPRVGHLFASSRGAAGSREVARAEGPRRHAERGGKVRRCDPAVRAVQGDAASRPRPGERLARARSCSTRATLIRSATARWPRTRASAAPA